MELLSQTVKLNRIRRVLKRIVIVLGSDIRFHAAECGYRGTRASDGEGLGHARCRCIFRDYFILNAKLKVRLFILNAKLKARLFIFPLTNK
jgi:hypothetical protein